MVMLTIDEIAELSELSKTQLTDLRLENDRMRASLANGHGPCGYCDLPKTRWHECRSGFPGCARGDDAMLCPHVGASLENDIDAARYRWLRDVGDATWRPFGLREGFSAAKADAAIDAAMQGETYNVANNRLGAFAESELIGGLYGALQRLHAGYLVK